MSSIGSFEHFRAHATDVAVTPRPIVRRFNVVCDVLRPILSVFVNMLLDPFLLKTSEKRFSNSVVPAVSTTAHAGHEMMGFAEPPPGIAPILRALIGMNQGTSWCKVSGLR